MTKKYVIETNIPKDLHSAKKIKFHFENSNLTALVDGNVRFCSYCRKQIPASLFPSKDIDVCRDHLVLKYNWKIPGIVFSDDEKRRFASQENQMLKKCKKRAKSVRLINHIENQMLANTKNLS